MFPFTPPELELPRYYPPTSKIAGVIEKFLQATNHLKREVIHKEHSVVYRFNSKEITNDELYDIFKKLVEESGGIITDVQNMN